MLHSARTRFLLWAVYRSPCLRANVPTVSWMRSRPASGRRLDCARWRQESQDMFLATREVYVSVTRLTIRARLGRGSSVRLWKPGSASEGKLQRQNGRLAPSSWRPFFVISMKPASDTCPKLPMQSRLKLREGVPFRPGPWQKCCVSLLSCWATIKNFVRALLQGALRGPNKNESQTIF